MTKFRQEHERRAAFERLAARLDRSLANARPSLAAAPAVTVVDECDRGSFDPGWYPAFRWRYRFTREANTSGCVVRVAVTLAYEEPLVADEPPSPVRRGVHAEVFT